MINILDTKITFRTEGELKEDAQKLFKAMGIDMSTALNMFLQKAVTTQSIPWKLEVEWLGSEVSNCIVKVGQMK